jgi:hypothetical protein
MMFLTFLPNGELGWADFFQKINETMILLHTKFGKNPVRIFQDMMKM